MGVVTQLMMQNQAEEARRVAEFFAQVGLPINLAQVGLSPEHSGALDDVAAGAMAFAPIHNLPFTVSAETVKAGVLAADALGTQVASELGDAAYRRVQS